MAERRYGMMNQAFKLRVVCFYNLFLCFKSTT